MPRTHKTKKKYIQIKETDPLSKNKKKIFKKIKASIHQVFKKKYYKISKPNFEQKLCIVINKMLYHVCNVTYIASINCIPGVQMRHYQYFTRLSVNWEPFIFQKTLDRNPSDQFKTRKSSHLFTHIKLITETIIKIIN